MQLLRRLLNFRRSYFLPSDEFEQYLKDTLRQQEKRARWINVACLDVLLPEAMDPSSLNVERILKDHARTVMTRHKSGRYVMLSAMIPEDAERHLDYVHMTLRNTSKVFPDSIGFNVSLMSFNCFIPILEFDQKMDDLLAEVSILGQNVLLHEIVEV